MKDSTAWIVTEAARSQVGPLHEHVFARIASGQSRHLARPASDAQRSRIAPAAHQTETVGSPQNLAIADSPPAPPPRPVMPHPSGVRHTVARWRSFDCAGNRRRCRCWASRAIVCHLNVYGLPGLLVTYGAIMPRVTTGNTMAPSVVIGERAADLIRKEDRL